MKGKLILIETIMTVGLIGIFFLFFGLVDGWSDPLLRYDAAVAVSVVTAAVAFFAAIIVTAFFAGDDKSISTIFALCLIAHWLMIFGIFKLMTSGLV